MIFDELQKDTMEVKDETGKSVMASVPLRQLSYSKDAGLVTTYADDYITRGMAFEIQRRITLTTGQVLYLELKLPLAVGKFIYSLPLRLSSNSGNVFLDTYAADAATGGTAWTPINLNENSANVALATFKTGVGVPSGTPSFLREYSTGVIKTNQSGGGGSAPSSAPKILNSARPRYFKFTNQETSTVVVDFGFVWYEIDPD